MEAIREAIKKWLGITKVEDEMRGHQQWAMNHGHPHDHELDQPVAGLVKVMRADAGRPAPFPGELERGSIMNTVERERNREHGLPCKLHRTVDCTICHAPAEEEGGD